MCPSLRVLCVGERRLFVLVFPLATDHAEQEGADHRCEKGQADQRGRGRRRRGEVKDGHHHRQREDDFQKVGHWLERFFVSPGVQNSTGAPVALLTRWSVYSFTRPLVYRFARSPVYLFTYSTRSRGSHSSAHGGENHGQLFDHARAFEALADDGQNGVVARDRAAETFGVVGVNFGRDARRIARTGAHHD